MLFQFHLHAVAEVLNVRNRLRSAGRAAGEDGRPCRVPGGPLGKSE